MGVRLGVRVREKQRISDQTPIQWHWRPGEGVGRPVEECFWDTVLVLKMPYKRVRFPKDMTAPVIMFALLEDVAGASSVLRQHDVITLLLIFLFFFALGMGVLFFLGYRFLRSNRLTIRPATRKRADWLDAKRFQSRLFESPIRWIAIRSGNLLLV